MEENKKNRANNSRKEWNILFKMQQFDLKECNFENEAICDYFILKIICLQEFFFFDDTDYQMTMYIILSPKKQISLLREASYVSGV